jgi:hypothetical protein
VKLTKYEQETIILFNEEETTADVYTHNLKLKERLRQLAKEFPDSCVLSEKNVAGGVTFRIDKKLVSIRRPYSEERRQRDRERALAENRRPPKKERKKV